MKPAIRIERLSKQFRIGARSDEGYRTLREAMVSAAAAPWRRIRELSGKLPAGDGASAGTHQALDDLSLEIQPDEVVGIIGRNGAGKSTLLKILSRITEPTSGRVELRGRVGSLLEVGTGFHQELTGRENIYLNGAILGMSRREVDRKFDEIVAFAEVEKFLDTPVKRYSSGMYVRLAFAVASHLESEILIVDEVLAVGDAAFQKKCLGRLGEIGRSGRAVLFVSHNMAAIRNLCRRVACLEHGRLAFLGDCEPGIEYYAKNCSEDSGGEVDLTGHANRRPGSDPCFRGLRLLDDADRPTSQFLCGERLRLELRFAEARERKPHNLIVRFQDIYGMSLFSIGTHLSDSDPIPLDGRTRVVCDVDAIPLVPGRYSITLEAGIPLGRAVDVVEQAAWFDVLPTDFYGNGRLPSPASGRFLVRSRWDAHDVADEVVG
jgi:lipopolysaccharide transport system ATP-binding protein